MELILQNKCVRVLIWKVTSESEVNSNPKFVPQTRWVLGSCSQLYRSPSLSLFIRQARRHKEANRFFTAKKTRFVTSWKKQNKKTLVWGSKKSGDAFLSVRLNEDNFGLTCLCQNLFQFTNVIAKHFLFKDVGSENMIWADTFLPFVFSLNSRLCSCPEGPLTQWPFHSAFYLSGLSSLSDVCIERDLLHV